MFKRLFIRLCLVLAGVLVALLLVEATLRVTHPRYADAASMQWVDDMDLGFHRAPGHRSSSRNPDTGEAHPVLHNALGMRMHRQVLLPPEPGAAVHAFFGDSFAENIFLPAPLTFTEALHYLLNTRADGGHAEVLNFGVDGYGLGQELLAFRRFRQRHPGIRLDHVYYLHCGNDLRNLFETRLFSLGPDGQPVRRRLREPGPALRLARRLYLTYFLMERGVLDRGRLSRLLRQGPENLYRDEYGAVIDPAFARQRKRLRTRLRASMKEDTLAMLEGELPRIHPGSRLFHAVLDTWRREVEAQGGAFHIVVLPDISSRGLAKQLAREYSVLYLASAFQLNEPGHYIEQEMYFKKDGHWNGLANLLTADALNRWIGLKFTKAPELKDPRVDPALGPWTAAAAPGLLDRMFTPEQAAKFRALPASETEGLLAPYQALERN